MSTLQRPLFNMPPGMMEGTGITSMAMDAPPPMAMDAPPPMAMEGQMAMDEQAAADLGGMLAGQLAAGVEQTEQNIDAAEDSVGIMNALRGKNQTEEEYRDELAQYVGPNDAKYTPDSVLALVQPTMAMMEMGDMAAMMPGAGEGGLGEMMAGPDMAAMMPTNDMVGGVAEILPPSDMPVAEGPQVFGIEEEIFGKMPVQKLQLGGLTGRAGEFYEQFSALKPEPKGTWETALTVGAPFVQALLTPPEQGGGILGGLRAASGAAAEEMKQRRGEETQFGLQFGSDAIKMAQTENLARLQQESEKQKELIKAAAASKKGYKPQPEEIWLQKLNDPNTSPEDKKVYQALLTKKTIIPQSDAAGMVQAAEIANTAAENAYFRDRIKEQRDALGKAVANTGARAELGRNFIDVMEGYGGASTVTGSFVPSVAKFKQSAMSLGRLLGKEEEVERFLDVSGLGKDVDEVSAQVLEDFGKRFTLIEAPFIKGNLNQSEFNEVSSLGPKLWKSPEAIKQMVYYFELAEKRALAKQDIALNIMKDKSLSPEQKHYKMIEDIAAFKTEYSKQKTLSAGGYEKGRTVNFDPIKAADFMNTKTVQAFIADSQKAKARRGRLEQMVLSANDSEAQINVLRTLLKRSFDRTAATLGMEEGYEIPRNSQLEIAILKKFQPGLKELFDKLGLSSKMNIDEVLAAYGTSS